MRAAEVGGQTIEAIYRANKYPLSTIGGQEGRQYILDSIHQASKRETLISLCQVRRLKSNLNNTLDMTPKHTAYLQIITPAHVSCSHLRGGCAN